MKNKDNKIKSSDILRLLKRHHNEDVFVPECKDGSTWFDDHVRIDAWAMKKSWKSKITWGYEIKVSNSDFRNDNKWKSYLSLCSDFYFVTAPGIISKEEIPDQAGWIEVSKNCKRLFIRKKAPSRDVSIPEDLYRYILMSRASISKRNETCESSIDKWRQWLIEKSDSRKVGHLVRIRMAKEKLRMVDNVERENQSLKLKMKEYDRIKECLVFHGIDIDDHKTWKVKNVMKEITEIVPENMVFKLKSLKKDIEISLDVIESLKES